MDLFFESYESTMLDLAVSDLFDNLEQVQEEECDLHPFLLEDKSDEEQDPGQ